MEHHTDILIVGGGTGGIAAALAVARAGGRCLVSEPTDWVGGQLTAQAVPPDENQWVEGTGGVVGATGFYRELREGVRRWYRAHRDLTAEAKRDPYLNPGHGWVSRLCCEPRVVYSVLWEMLSEYVEAGRIKILHHHEPVEAEVEGDRVTAVALRDLRSGERVWVRAAYVLDATETGDLFPLAGVEYAVGAEHRDVHGELHGRPDRTAPEDQQAISWCFALEHCAGENHVIDRPEGYAFWRDFVPDLDVPWPGRLFSWTVPGHEASESRTLPMVPWPEEPKDGQLELWRYRRIVDHSIYADEAAAPPDVSLINWVQMDYFLKPLLDVPEQTRAEALAGARQQSLCFLYWLQTEAPRHDSLTATGYPGLKLRGRELGTEDGFAKAAYIREARRLKARTIVTEGHIGLAQRRMEGKLKADAPEWGVCESFQDSVGVGHYRLDLHPSTGGRNSIYVEAAPFRIPMGALIPERMRNVLAAGKNLGVTHVTNGCYRVHSVEWNIGEAAGLLAWWCMAKKTEPHAVHGDPAAVRAFQSRLVDQGVSLRWPWEAPLVL